MNPFPIALALARRNWLTTALFLFLITVSVALGVAITAQERALREGSARASDPFDLIVAAQGSQTEVMFNVVYLRPSAVELIQPETLATLLQDPRAEFVAPVAFGDSAGGFPVVGTTADMIRHLIGDAPLDGRLWNHVEEAVVGARVPFGPGDSVMSSHGVHFVEADHGEIAVVGKLPPTGTAWDNGVFVPIEYSWSTHGLVSGHDPARYKPDGTPPIGPPFDAAYLAAVPAVVMETGSLPAAYMLRQAYRTPETTAFFPAEVLSEIYGYLGDVRAIMSAMAIATQVLVVAAILSGIVALVQLYRTRLAVLRAMGATKGYVFAVMWTYIMALVLGGTLLGLAGGYGVAQAISAVFSAETGLTLSARIGGRELALAGALAGLGAVLAVVPAVALFRRPAVTYLR